MKNPLHYQISEYDCGPTSMLNAIIYLFDRGEIPPEVIRNTMLYCLDCYSKEGIPGKRGTSRAAMMFLSNWLNEYGNLGIMTVSSEYLSGVKDGNILMFDPYYWDEPYEEKDVLIDLKHPEEYNREVPFQYFNCEEDALYAFGKVDSREAVLVYNEKTRVPVEEAIEYFI